jgi:hypothetical protein
MSQQSINLGTADSGNGDPLRTAFDKVNDNFTELYSSVIATGVVSTSASPPVSPGEGDLWWDTTDGNLYVYYSGVWTSANAGVQGPQGEIGPQGLEGPAGIRGLKGNTGDIGPRGFTGETGAQGEVGPRGLKGDQGDAGANGLDGAQGIQGEVGAQGPRGIKGDQGDPGTNGTNGTNGETGPQGEQGPRGLAGINGTNGDPGPQGDPGTQVQFSLSAPNPLTEGNVWWNMNDGNLYVYYNNQWVSAVSITGITDRLVNGTSELVLDEIGMLTVPGTIVLQDGVITLNDNTDPGIVLGSSNKSVFVRTLSGIDQYTWKFGTDGKLTLPDSATVAVGDISVLQDLELAYDNSREQLNAAFAADSYEGDGWPAGPNSYNALLLSTDPAIRPEWIPLAQSVRTAWLALGSALEPIYLDIQVAGHTWNFSNAGDLSVPGNKAIKGFDNLQLNVDGGGGKTAVVEIDGYNSKVLIKTTTPGAGIIDDAWTFGDAGELTLPVGGVIQTLTTPEVGTRLTDIPGWIRADINAKTAGFWMDTTPQSLKDAMDATGLVDWQFNPDGTTDYYTVLAAEYVEGNTILELTFDANLPLESAPYSVESPNYSTRTSSNISILANENEWTFDTDGKLSTPSGLAFGGANGHAEITNTSPNGSLYIVHTGLNQLVVEWTAGNNQLPVGEDVQTAGIYAGVTGLNIGLLNDQDVSHSWQFAGDGSLRIPGDIRSLGNINIDIDPAGPTLQRWTFSNDGALTFPDSTVQTTAWTGSVNSLVNGVHTATLDNYGHLVLSQGNIEGTTGVGIWANDPAQPDYPVVWAFDNIEEGTGNPTHRKGIIQLPFLQLIESWHNNIRLTNPGLSSITMSGDVVIRAKQQADGDYKTWGFGTDGTLTLPGDSNGTIGENATGLAITSEREFSIFANSVESFKLWRFGTDGALTLPADSSILTNETALNIATHSTTTYTFNQAYWEALNANVTRMFTPSSNAQYFACTVTANQNGTYTVDVTGIGNGFNPGNWFKIPGNELGGTTPANDIQITVATINGGGGILTTTITGTAVGKQWQFGTTGGLTFPDNTVQSTAYPGIFTGYDYEIHVSQTDGNDTSGNGDLLKPVASITKALTLISGQRRTIIIHPGTYTESPTITVQYTVLTTFEPLGGNTAIIGTVSTSVGCTITGLTIENLTITAGTGVGVPNIINCNISGTLTKSGNATFTDIHNCDIGTACNITGNGLVTINDGNPSFVTVNNAGASVIIKNSMSCIAPSVIAGTLNVVDAVVIAAVTNAVTSSASTVVSLANCQILTSALTAVAPVSLSGFYSIFNCVFDKPNSTLASSSGTGGSTNSIDYFQYINADRLILASGGQITFPDATVQTTAYQKVAVPAHSYGAAGDQAGMLAFDSTYIYYCTANYVNDTTDIWKRTAHGAGTW